MLNDQQRNSLAHFRRLKEDKQRSLMQKKFDEAWKEVQDYVRMFIPGIHSLILAFKTSQDSPTLDKRDAFSVLLVHCDS